MAVLSFTLGSCVWSSSHHIYLNPEPGCDQIAQLVENIAIEYGLVQAPDEVSGNQCAKFRPTRPNRATRSGRWIVSIQREENQLHLVLQEDHPGGRSREGKKIHAKDLVLDQRCFPKC